MQFLAVKNSASFALYYIALHCSGMQCHVALCSAWERVIRVSHGGDREPAVQSLLLSNIIIIIIIIVVVDFDKKGLGFGPKSEGHEHERPKAG